MRTVIVCSGCNNDKGNRTLSEWLDVLRDAGDPRAETVAAFIAENRELMEDELTLHWAEAAARCAPASIIAGVSA